MSSLILRTANQFIVPVTLLFAAYMALKGHNLPGGGFIGGLIAAVSLVLYRMSHGRAAMSRIMPFHPRVMVAAGLAIATLTGVVALCFGKPMLYSEVIYIDLPYTDATADPFYIPSAFFFDVGVMLVVVGISVGMIVRLGEEIEEVDEA
ncbi:MAG: MnhB domain-containing protein [Planctomycetota bacterium]